MKFLASILFVFFYCSCSDVILNRKNIGGKYYLYRSESTLLKSVYYKTQDGDYIGRILKEVQEYYYTDSFLVTKTIENKHNFYYIIDIKKDYDFASESQYLIGPLNEFEFITRWKTRIGLKEFEKVK